MNRIGGPDRSTNISRKWEKPGNPTNVQPDRDMQTEGQHFSDLLQEKPGNQSRSDAQERQYSASTNTPDWTEHASNGPTPAAPRQDSPRYGRPASPDVRPVHAGSNERVTDDSRHTAQRQNSPHSDQSTSPDAGPVHAGRADHVPSDLRHPPSRQDSFRSDRAASPDASPDRAEYTPGNPPPADSCQDSFRSDRAASPDASPVHAGSNERVTGDSLHTAQRQDSPHSDHSTSPAAGPVHAERADHVPSDLRRAAQRQGSLRSNRMASPAVDKADSTSTDDPEESPDAKSDPDATEKKFMDSGRKGDPQDGDRQTGSGPADRAGTTVRTQAGPEPSQQFVGDPSTPSGPVSPPGLGRSAAASELRADNRAARVADNPVSAASGKQGAGKDFERHDDSSEATADVPRYATGDQILQGMLGRVAESDQANATQPAPISDHIAELVDRLAERVLVSDRSANPDSAVRIHLRDSVLGGAEIAINRDGGQVVVAFNVPDSAVGRQLEGHVDDLQRQLGNKIKEPVSIQVNIGSNASDSGGDGRSRNRRDPNTEWQSDE